MKVSIIIPIYNAEKYLTRCIESIIKQKNEAFEVILVDDGSQDRSIDICMKYQDKFKDIDVIQRENGGEGVARNSGMEVASGEWITFVDADDTVENNFCMDILDALDEQSDFILFESKKRRACSNISDKSIGDKNQKVVEFNAEMREKLIQNNFLGKRLLPDFDCSLRSVCGKVYRSTFLKKHKILFDRGVPIGADMLFSLKVYGLANNFKCVYKNIYNYFQNTDSITYRYKPDYNNMVDAYNQAIHLWLKAYPEYKPYFFNYRLNDIILFMKYVIFHKENVSLEKDKRFAVKKLFCDGKYIRYYKISRKCKLTRNYSFVKRVTFWLAVHNFYTILKLISYIRYYQKG